MTKQLVRQNSFRCALSSRVNPTACSKLDQLLMQVIDRLETPLFLSHKLILTMCISSPAGHALGCAKTVKEPLAILPAASALCFHKCAAFDFSHACLWISQSL